MNSFLKIAAIGLISLSQFACSNSQFLKGMSVSVTEKNSEEFINLSAEVNLGNSSLASLTIPIFDQRNHLQLGQVSFGQAASGNQQITISLDATSVLHADSTLGLTLPNGLPIPASLGVVSGSLLAIPILDSSRVYIGGDLKTSIVIGAALGIKGLDHVTGGIGLAGNIFFSQIFNPDLSGIAGLYASPNANENGIAVFAKYTLPKVAPVPAPRGILAALAVKIGMGEEAASEPNQLALSSSSGITPETGNEIENEALDSDTQENLLRYFYGRKRILRPN